QESLDADEQPTTAEADERLIEVGRRMHRPEEDLRHDPDDQRRDDDQGERRNGPLGEPAKPRRSEGPGQASRASLELSRDERPTEQQAGHEWEDRDDRDGQPGDPRDPRSERALAQAAQGL